MSHWEDNYKVHEIHASIDKLNTVLEDSEFISDDLNFLAIIERIHEVKVYVEVSLENLIPSLVNHSSLDKANALIVNMIKGSESFLSTKEGVYLNQTNVDIDGLIIQLNSFPLTTPKITQQSFTKSLIEFKSLSEKVLSNIKEAKEDFEKSIMAISHNAFVLDDKVNSIASVADQHEKKSEELFSDLDHRITELNDFFTKEINEKNDVFSERYESFSTISAMKLDELQAANSEKVNDLLAANAKGHAEQLEQQQSEAQYTLDILDEKKIEASNLLQIIGNIGITGNYRKVADTEKKSADNWRRLALLLMVLMVLSVIGTIFISAGSGFDWKLVLFRIGAALILAVPATYAAKESSRHRNLESHSRRSELELASLNPYIETLPQETKDKIKEELTKKFFGQGFSDEKTEDTVSAIAIADLLKLAITKK